MEIRNIGGVNPSSQNPKKSAISSNTKKDAINQDDSFKVSNEAIFHENEELIRSALKNTPDIDHKKIDSVKERLENGYYNNAEVLDTLTENIMKALGL